MDIGGVYIHFIIGCETSFIVQVSTVFREAVEAVWNEVGGLEYWLPPRSREGSLEVHLNGLAGCKMITSEAESIFW